MTGFSEAMLFYTIRKVCINMSSGTFTGLEIRSIENYIFFQKEKILHVATPCILQTDFEDIFGNVGIQSWFLNNM